MGGAGSLNGPGEEAVCESGGVGPEAPTRGQWVKQEVGRVQRVTCGLVFLKQENLAMAARGGREKAIIFWAVLITLCTAFLFSVVAPAYLMSGIRPAAAPSPGYSSSGHSRVYRAYIQLGAKNTALQGSCHSMWWVTVGDRGGGRVRQIGSLHCLICWIKGEKVK